MIVDPTGQAPPCTDTCNRELKGGKAFPELGSKCHNQVLLPPFAVLPPTLAAWSPIAIFPPDKRDRRRAASLSRPGFGSHLQGLDSREPLNSEFAQIRVRQCGG